MKHKVIKAEMMGPDVYKRQPFMLVALVFIFLGTIGESDLVWACSDMFNQLMVIPNAIALFALTGVVTKILGDRDK